MLFKIDDNLWFDNEKLYIVTGEENKNAYMKHIDELPCINYKKPQNWKPTLVFLSSTRCNLKCKYCYAEQGTYGMDDEEKFFNLSKYVYVFEYFHKAFGGVRAISFFGGEPMLNYSEIKKFVLYLNENYNQSERPLLGIASNGTIMDNEKSQFLKKYGIHFGTSLDGCKQYNDRYRVGEGIESVFDYVKRTLEALGNSDLIKIIQFTLTKDYIENYSEGDIVKVMEELERIPYSACELVPVESNDSDIMIDLDNTDILHRYRMMCFDLVKLHIDRLCTEGVHPSRLSRLLIGLIVRISRREYQNDCSAGRSVCISPQMMIFPCHSLATVPEYGVRFDENFKLEDLEANPYFAEAMNTSRKKSPECQKCIAQQLCPFWCRGLNYCYNGDLHIVLRKRCEMMRIFLTNAIKFMVSERYKINKEIVHRNVVRTHKSFRLLQKGERFHAIAT